MGVLRLWQKFRVFNVSSIATQQCVAMVSANVKGQILIQLQYNVGNPEFIMLKSDQHGANADGTGLLFVHRLLTYASSRKEVVLVLVWKEQSM